MVHKVRKSDRNQGRQNEGAFTIGRDLVGLGRGGEDERGVISGHCYNSKKRFALLLKTLST